MHLDAQQREGAAMHFPPLAHPRELQAVDDVEGGQVVGVDDAGDACRTERLDDLAVGQLDVFDLGDGLSGTHGLGQHAQAQVLVLVGRYGDKKARLVDTGLLEHTHRSGRGAMDGHQIAVRLDAFKLLFIIIDDDDVLVDF